MTLLISDCPDFKLYYSLKAIYLWVKAFNYDYEKYTESLFPWDLDIQDNFFINSKEYY